MVIADDGPHMQFFSSLAVVLLKHFHCTFFSDGWELRGPDSISARACSRGSFPQWPQWQWIGFPSSSKLLAPAIRPFSLLIGLLAVPACPHRPPDGMLSTEVCVAVTFLCGYVLPGSLSGSRGRITVKSGARGQSAPALAALLQGWQLILTQSWTNSYTEDSPQLPCQVWIGWTHWATFRHVIPFVYK